MEATPAATKPAKKASPLTSPRFSASSSNVRRIFEEKEEMQNLNDRLAVYIDKMRRLEDRNSSLTAEVTRWKDKESSEVFEVKKIFEGELSNARQLLDDIAKEKSRIELENARNSSLASDLQKKLDKESQSSARAEDKVKSLTKKLNEKDALLADLRDEHISLKEQFDRLKKESSNLQDALNSARYDLEQKTLEKVDLENRIQTLSEDSDFKRRMYEQELADIKEQMVTFESSKSYMETDFKQKYDNVMKDKLQELRDEFEEEADNIKNDIENNYTHKLSDLKNSQNNTRAECDRQTVIIRECKACLEALKIDKSVLETELNSYKKRLEELERLRAVEKDDLNKQLEEKSNEIKDLKDIIEDRNKEYEELMGIKVALDLEISAYRKLLEGEEERLNITATQTPSPPRRKRARIDIDSPQGPDVVSTAKGSIQIAECDPEGKFVKIFNSSANEEPLGGWVVDRKVGDQEAVGFKFNPRSILKGGATVTLWSAASGMKHKPPTDLVMKTSNWAPGTDALTTIQNSEGEVVAQMTQTSPLEKEPIKRKQRRRTDKNESCVIS